MAEPKTKYWEDLSGSWGESRQHLWRKHSDAVNRELITQWLPTGVADSALKTDLFDEMCGVGLVPLIESRAGRVVGVDISHCALQKARARNSEIRGVVANVLRLPFAGESFDYILSNSTLDHFGSLTEIRGSLAELFRVMRWGGEMTITMDNPTNPFIAVRNKLPFRLLNRLGVTPYFVGVTCSAKELRQLLQDAGFVVREDSTVMHCPRVIAVGIARLLEKLPFPGLHRIFLQTLMSFEKLSRLQTHRLTGYFVAVRAAKEKALSSEALQQSGEQEHGT
jgi:SAM-dependent methyltransferase